MGSFLFLLVLFVCSLNPYCIESWKLSEEEDLELETHLKLLNKPAVKTIKSRYGDVYDCVDFYKQPAFDHPLLKNFTFEKSKLLRIQKREKLSSRVTQGISLDGGGCPLGTVAIKRITKEDLIRERLASKLRSLIGNEKPGAHYAIARAQAANSYAGIAANFSVWNPPCVGMQYSSARVKIMNGSDSIEAGWRVDPTLYGDGLTRFYIRTDTETTHCFDTRCPGFVVTTTNSPLGHVFSYISKIGGPSYETRVNIISMPGSGQWNIEVGPNNVIVGIWMPYIFSEGGLGNLASSLEWGGEVFSPPGTPKPPMGAGHFPEDDTNVSAFFYSMEELNASGNRVPAEDVLRFADSKHYKIIDEGYTGDEFGSLIVYGGRGGSTD